MSPGGASLAALASPPVASSAGGEAVAYLASDADDAEIRALLRERPTEGAIAIALTREPHFRDGAAVDGDWSSTVLVRHARTRRLLGLGTRSVREVYHRGEAVRVGYLGQLRAAEGGFGIRRLRAGYALLGAGRGPGELPFDLTAIAADNAAARRLLERGLAGIPRYRHLGDVVTLVLGTAGLRVPRQGTGARVGPAFPADLPRIAAFLQRSLSRRAFAPRWSAERLAGCPGLRVEDFVLAERNGALVGCGACWDQRAFKQVVVTGYGPWLRRLRPALNLALGCAGRPALPPPGSTLDLGYLSHLALADGAHTGTGLALVEHLLAAARRRGLEHLVVAFARGDALLEAVRRRFAARAYHSCLYAVLWDELATPGDVLAGEPLHVEAATL